MDISLPSSKYSYTLHAKFEASKAVIIIYSLVVNPWFTFAECVFQTAKAKTIVFCIVFCI